MNTPSYLPNPWHELLESFLHAREYPWFAGRLRYLRDFTRVPDHRLGAAAR